MMFRKLPPLNWARSFEAAARHCSFTRASEELNVTQAAISQQVKSLEGRLGIALFQRDNNRLSLTHAGQTWLPKLRTAFDLIEASISEIHANRDVETLTVRLPSSFSIQWLMPRLKRFHIHNPRIHIQLLALEREMDASESGSDIEIRNGPGSWQDQECILLMREEVFPVCSPDLFNGSSDPKIRSNIADHELLHVSGYREDWPMWFEAAGLGDVAMRNGLFFDQSVTAIQAAKNGLGIALGRSVLVANDIAEGCLVSPFDVKLQGEDSYWITFPRHTSNRLGVQAFRDWLLDEAGMEN